MPWFRLEDDFYLHPKVSSAGNAATGLWVRCGTYSAHYLTDGHIPTPIARQLGTRNEIAALLDTGLWAANGDGFVIPDFLEYQPCRTDVEAERARISAIRAEAGRRGGIASGIAKQTKQTESKQ